MNTFVPLATLRERCAAPDHTVGDTRRLIVALLLSDKQEEYNEGVALLDAQPMSEWVSVYKGLCCLRANSPKEAAVLAAQLMDMDVSFVTECFGALARKENRRHEAMRKFAIGLCSACAFAYVSLGFYCAGELLSWLFTSRRRRRY